MHQSPLIAIINDDPAFLEFIASFLEDETHYQTIVWDDGVGSLPKLRAYVPDLVILDVRLGDQAVGQEILANMRQDEMLAKTPVLVCTADAHFIRENLSLLHALGADVLEKPFDLEVLEQKVQSALNGVPVRKGEVDPVG
jgi:DNA-binding response OmpR family regulator